MSRMKNLLLPYALMAMSMGSEGLFMGNGLIGKRTPSKTVQKPIPAGANKFEYDDGFSCYALNQKNADRKHNNFLKNENK